MIKLYHKVILGIVVNSLILSCNQNLETKPIVEDKLSRELMFEKGIEIKNTNFNGCWSFLHNTLSKCNNIVWG